MRVLASRSAAKTLSEKILLLLNREGWSEVATECIISLPDLRMHFSQIVERFGTWRGLWAYCTPSSVFEKFRVPFPLLLFPWTDFHKCFNFFPHSFRDSNYFLCFPLKFCEKNMSYRHGRVKLIPLCMSDVWPLCCIYPTHIFQNVFCVVRWHKETSLQSELCPVSAIDM